MTCQKCEICKEAPSKYKCPTCLVHYCSLGCFKKHKENQCIKLQTSVEDSTSNELPKRSYQVDEASWLVSKERLLSIVRSSEIRDALKDSNLRKLIRKIDSSKDPEAVLTKAMSGQSFHNFTEKILSLLNPQE